MSDIDKLIEKVRWDLAAAEKVPGHGASGFARNAAFMPIKARIEALEQERAEWQKCAEDRMARIAEMELELASAREDTARLDWLLVQRGHAFAPGAEINRAAIDNARCHVDE